MRNKLNLKEGEIQRILGLHKKAIIKEHKISSLNEELLMEKTYEINLMKRGGNNNWLKPKDKVTKFKVKNYNKDMVEGEVTIKDGNRDEVIPVQFDCKKPDVMDITDDSQIRGSQYRTDEKLKNLIKWYCAGKPKKDTGGGEDGKKTYKQAYDQKLKYDTPQEIRGANGYKMTFTDLKIPAGTIYTSLPEKNGISFKIKSGDKVLFGWFGCKSKKFSVNKIPLTDEKKALTKKLVSELCKVADSKKNINNPDPNSGKNEEGNDGFLAAGTSGTKYSFDFETIMKAIDDTGKCPRTGTSDQAGTSGTSGVQGTQGTSGVGAPVVIQKPTVTKDDFYQWTMD
jgi:hypothetical protein